MFPRSLLRLTNCDARIGVRSREQAFQAAQFQFCIRIQKKEEFAGTLPGQKIYPSSKSIVPQRTKYVSGTRQSADRVGERFGSAIVRRIIEKVGSHWNRNG